MQAVGNGKRHEMRGQPDADRTFLIHSGPCATPGFLKRTRTSVASQIDKTLGLAVPILD